MEITIDLKYQCYKGKGSSRNLRNVRKYNRIIKKNIKIALFDISNTLNNYNWGVVIIIFNYIDDEDFKCPVKIELFSKNNNLKGSVCFINEQILLSTNQMPSSLSEQIFYRKGRLNFNKDFFNKNVSSFFVISAFPKSYHKILEFQNIENAKIKEFKNKYEGFLNYINSEKLYEFKQDSSYCTFQLFYIGEQIHWCSNYFHYYYENPIQTMTRNISECHENDFIRTLIEAKVININQDIEEVLEWDIKDIFEMSKLIGY